MIRAYPECDISESVMTTSIPPYTINPGLEIFNAGVMCYFGFDIRLYHVVSIRGDIEEIS